MRGPDAGVLLVPSVNMVNGVLVAGWGAECRCCVSTLAAAMDSGARGADGSRRGFFDAPALDLEPELCEVFVEASERPLLFEVPALSWEFCRGTRLSQRQRCQPLSNTTYNILERRFAAPLGAAFDSKFGHVYSMPSSA